MKELKDKYDTVVNLNMDCLGGFIGGPIQLSGSASLNGDLYEVLLPMLQEADIPFEVTYEELRSDEDSFIDAGYPAVGFIH